MQEHGDSILELVCRSIETPFLFAALVWDRNQRYFPLSFVEPAMRLSGLTGVSLINKQVGSEEGTRIDMHKCRHMKK